MCPCSTPPSQREFFLIDTMKHQTSGGQGQNKQLLEK